MSHTSIDCPHCNTDDSGAKIASGGRMPEEDGEARYYFVAVCQKCGAPTVIIARQVTGRIGEGAPLVRHVCRTNRDPIPNFIEPVRFFPERSARRDLPIGVPENVASAYGEALECRQRGFSALAAMGLRHTLERASRALRGDPNKPLAARLGAVARSSGLHPSFVDWAERIALLESDMAASESDPADEDLAELASFTEMLLTCAFTVPHRIESHRKAVAPATDAQAVRQASDESFPSDPNVATLPLRPRGGAMVHVRKIASAY